MYLKKYLVLVLAILCFGMLHAEDKSLLMSLSLDDISEGKCLDTADPGALVLVKGDPKPELVTGRFGNALRFTDKSQNLLNRTQRDIAPQKFTFEFWIKPEANEKYEKSMQSLFQGPQSQIYYKGFCIRLDKGCPSLVMNCGEKHSIKYTVSKEKGFVKPGKWTHLAFSYDGDSVRIYRDGDEIYEKVVKKPVNYLPGRSWMMLGTCPGGTCFSTLDEVKLYGRALSNDEIAQSAGKYFKFNLGPNPANSGAEKQGKWYHYYSPSKVDGPKSLTRCLGFTGKPHDRFFDSEEKNVVLKIKNLAPETSVFTLETVIDDCWRKKTLSEKTRVISVPAKNEFSELIDLETGQSGCFLLKLKLLHDGKVVYSASRPYAVTVSQAKDFKAKKTPFGHHSHHGNHNSRFTPEISGNAIRLWLYTIGWFITEREKGKFDWEATDFIVDHYHKRGDKILFTLAYTPLWSSSAPKDAQTKYRYPPKDIKDWENFVRKLVRRYKGKVKWWEIWNEADSGYFMGTPEQYFELLKTAYQVLKEEDPECLVVGVAGTTQWYPFSKRIFEMGGHKFMDVLSVHFYVGSTPESTRLLPSIKAAKDLVRQYGKDMPVWDTESGYVSPRRQENGEMYDLPHGNKKLWSYSSSRPLPTLGERRVAAFAMRKRLLELSHGVEKVFHFDMMSNIKGGFPLVLVAWEAMLKNIADRKFVRRVPLGDDNLHAYLFAGEPNVLALWAAEGESDVILNCDAQKVELVDFVGNFTPKKSSTPLTVHLDAYPKYIVGCGLKVGPTSQLFELTPPKRVVRGKKVNFKLKNSSESGGDFKANITDKTMNSVYASLPIKLVAGESKNVSLDLPAKTPEGPAFLVVTMSSGKKGKHAKTIPVRIESPPASIVKADGIKIDGDFNDWTNAGKFSVNNVEQVKVGRYNPMFIGNPHWRDTDDLSGVFAMRWAEDGLFIVVQITDDQLKLAADEKFPFRGDCLELFFDFRQGDEFGKKPYSPGVVQIILPPPSTTGEVKFQVPGNSSHTANEKATKKIQAAGKRLFNGYVIEAFIPAKLFNVDNFKGERVFGFDLAIDDADPNEKNGERKVQMIYRGTKNNYMDASRFAIFKLQEK